MKNPAVQNFLKVFEIVATFVLLNIIMLVGSVFSAFILTPLLVYSMFRAIRKLYDKDYDNMLIDYFANMKHKFIRVTRIGYPLILAIVFLLYLFFFVNPVIADLVSIYFYAAILGSQILLMYIIVSVTMIYLMSLSINPEAEDVFRKSTIIVFGYFGKTIFAFLAMFIVPSILLSFSYFFLFLIIPCSLIGYHIIMNKTLLSLYK